MPATAQRIVLERGTVGTDLRFSVVADKRNCAGDAVWPVLGDLDRRLAGAIPIDLSPGLDAVDRVAERSGGAVADRPDDLAVRPIRQRPARSQIGCVERAKAGIAGR